MCSKIRFNLVIVVLVNAYACVPTFAADDFATDFDQVRGKSIQKLGRDSIIAEYSKLIDTYSNDPRVAEAMFKVATLLENSNPKIGLKAEREEALKWYRKAVEASSPGTEIWGKSRRLLAHRLLNKGPKFAEEAKNLFDQIARESKSDSFEQAQSVYDAYTQALKQHDLVAAERHSNTLMNWYNDPNRIPKDPEKKKLLDGYISGSASGLVQAFATSKVEKGKQVSRITEFVSKHPGVPGLAESSQVAIQNINNLKNWKPTGSPAKLAKREISTKNSIFIWTNLAVIVALAATIIWRRRRASQA